jgi:hypothetical protein
VGSLKALDKTQEWPLLSVRLKSTNTDAIAILQGISVLVSAAGNYNIKVVQGGTLGNASFTSASVDSAVEYDVSATDITGGDERQSTVLSFSNQSTATLDLGEGDLFGFQLERDGLSNSTIPYTIVIVGSPNNFNGGAAVNWEEIF